VVAAQWPVFVAPFERLFLLLLLLPGVAHAGRVERLKLTAPDAAQSSAFGRSVDLIGSTAIVGSYSGASPPGGTACLFDISTGEQRSRTSEA